METLARAVMTQIPPNAIDRQAVCEVLGRAESATRAGRNKDAAKLLMQAGSAIYKLQHEQAIAVAETIFQAAVKHARTTDADAPEYMRHLTESGNSELGDAYTWLGTCENRLGKASDAEGHYKAAAKAVEDEGLAAYADKFVHRVMLYRLRKDFERHEQLCDAWEETIRKAAREGVECETALLAATGICLQERAGGLADQGKVAESAELRGGKFLETVIRLQAHGLRPKPDVLLPNVYDSIAALYLRMNEKKKALDFLRKCVVSTARQERYADRFVPEGEERGVRSMDNWEDVCWHPSLLVTTKVEDGEGDVVPKAPWTMSDDEKETLELILRVGDRWTMKKGEPGREATRGANALGHILLTLGNQLLQTKDNATAQRVCKTSAGMFMHDPEMQGVALHLVGVSHFHMASDNKPKAKEILPNAAQAFALAAECRVGGGRCTKKGASEGISSLLFLGRCLFELDSPEDAERVTAQAISIGRQVLGDQAKETNEAIRAMMELKRQMSTR